MPSSREIRDIPKNKQLNETLGQEILHEMTLHGGTGQLFTYKQLQRLKKVTSTEELKKFLESNGLYEIDESASASSVAKKLVSVINRKAKRWQYGIFGIESLSILLGCLVLLAGLVKGC